MHITTYRGFTTLDHRSWIMIIEVRLFNACLEGFLFFGSWIIHTSCFICMFDWKSMSSFHVDRSNLHHVLLHLVISHCLRSYSLLPCLKWISTNKGHVGKPLACSTCSIQITLTFRTCQRSLMLSSILGVRFMMCSFWRWIAHDISIYIYILHII